MRRLVPVALGLILCAAQAPPEDPLQPYTGPSVRGVDPSTLDGKVMCGYQGWFSAEGDGSGRGWGHWTKNRSKPFDAANTKVDLWPDLREAGIDERFATALTHRDGRRAEVFSSFRKATVLRHVRWMREYGIDGAFVQRFIVDLKDPREARHFNTVLASIREGANLNGRVYAVMYDLTGLQAGRTGEVEKDWKNLRSTMKITDDPAYLRHRGKPVVALWGIGFSDKREYTLEECGSLVDVLKADGCSIMLGVPAYWRDGSRDATPDPALPDLLKRADILSPWSVGRFGKPEDAAGYAERTVKPDLAWCHVAKLDYLPVVFPGFSWHHMHAGKLDQIPRQKGRFYWAQWLALKKAGARMAYVAMFDEVDEATAIFKCETEVPSIDGGFVTYEGLPSDYYLKLTGSGGKLLRGEIPPADEPPR
ncbi:MAG TPA: glycoside hydrolase family 71/99-like protein [Planctomycetota bacterium]|nr:glycoside hydrolase family 71/99-like protein [Planctomycetota bacterium]